MRKKTADRILRAHKPKVHDVEMKAGLEGRVRRTSAWRDEVGQRERGADLTEAALEQITTKLAKRRGKGVPVIVANPTFLFTSLGGVLHAYRLAKINKMVPTFLKMLDQLVEENLGKA